MAEFKGSRSPGGFSPSQLEEMAKQNKDDKAFKGYRRPGILVPSPEELEPEGDTQLEPIVRKPGGRAPAMAEPEPVAEDIPEEDSPDFIHWWGNNIYKGTKEEKKKTEELSKAVKKVEEESGPTTEDLWTPPEGIKAKKDIEQENKEKYGEDYPRLKEAWEGFKGSYKDIPNSIRQIYNYATGDEELLKKLQLEAAENASKYDSTAGKAGYIIGALSQSIPMALIPGAGQVAGAGKMAQIGKLLSTPSIAKMAGIGAIQSALTTPTTSGKGSEGFLEEKGVQAGIGAGAGALGAGIAKGIGKLAKPSSRMIGNKPVQEIVQEAEKVGFKIPADVASESGVLKAVGEGARSMPGGQGVGKSMLEHNKALTQKLAVKMLDKDATELAPTRELTTRLWNKAGEAYQAVRDIPEINLDKGFKGELKELFKDAVNVTSKDSSFEGEAKKYLGKFMKEVTIPEDKGLIKLAEQMEKSGEKATAQEFRNLAKAQKIIKEVDSGKMTGSDFVSSSKYLRDLARNSKGELSRHYFKLSDALERSAERSLKESGDPMLSRELIKARTQMAKIKRIEEAWTNPETGELSLAKLFSTNAKKGGLSWLGKDLKTAVDTSKAFPKLLEGISPTAERIAAQDLIKGAGGVLAGGAVGGPAGALAGLLGPILGSKVTAKVLESPQAMKLIIEGLPAVQKQMPKLQGLLPQLGIQTGRSANK